ncbi:2,4-dienoyl-CoA reductase [Kushneria avicenniae]|uniref:2,4-dienoyl-CoA reductase n=1 Tax=Kushneria avicenniae TaxID=402385 RepID=A0A1I1GDN2_9GAMM|nr:alkene reductase [Kushneria avicenniae]SFC07210.1 2,4-dienoyl-CoA reductase [Kushneria avicenniae]
MSQKLFEAYTLGDITLSNRVIMAPMTRARAENEIPDELTARYYAQRAGAGLIVSEGVPVSKEGRGFLYTPGLFNAAQAEGWRHVTDAVHDNGGRIFAQLWHVGRVSHHSLQPDGGQPVGPTSRQAIDAKAFAISDETGEPGPIAPDQPRALEIEDIEHIIEDFARAARTAIDAGFDGVEIHAANGYLFDQFINGELNDRDDRYGGSIDNRLRFTLETLDAVIAEVGAGRVGIRVSPFGRFNDLKAFDGEAETWVAMAAELEKRGPVYVHLSDQLTLGAEKMPDGFAAQFCKTWTGTLIAAGGFGQASGEQALVNDELDLIAMGRPFIANPDLVDRMKNGHPLAEPNRETFYGLLGAKGYTDYPTWAEQQAGVEQEEA